METTAQYYAAAGERASAYHLRLIEEIAYLETRLEAIDRTGDSAFEKSLARNYGALLRERRGQLAESGIPFPIPA